MTSDSSETVYLYDPNHAAPAVFAALVGLSLLWHVEQNL